MLLLEFKNYFWFGRLVLIVAGGLAPAPYTCKMANILDQSWLAWMLAALVRRRSCMPKVTWRESFLTRLFLLKSKSMRKQVNTSLLSSSRRSKRAVILSKPTAVLSMKSKEQESNKASRWLRLDVLLLEFCLILLFTLFVDDFCKEHVILLLVVEDLTI